jgi:hypothetical protein
MLGLTKKCFGNVEAIKHLGMSITNNSNFKERQNKLNSRNACYYGAGTGRDKRIAVLVHNMKAHRGRGSIAIAPHNINLGARLR